MVATLLEAGVKHVFWVTLRDVKPQYISPGAWRQIQPYYWYFPTVNDHLEWRSPAIPSLSLIDWAAVADQPGPHVRRDPPQHAGLGALQRDRPAGGDRRHNRRTGRRRHADRDSGRSRSPGRGAQPHDRCPAGARLPDRLRLRPPATGGEQPQLHACPHGRPRRDLPVSASGEVCIFDNVATNLVVDITGRFGAAAGIGDANIETADRYSPTAAPSSRRSRRSRSRSALRPQRWHRSSRGAERHRRQR